MQAGVDPQPVLAHLNSGSEGGIEIGIEVWDSLVSKFGTLWFGSTFRGLDLSMRIAGSTRLP